jgi:hypothetical protein
LVIPTGILRIPVFSSPVALFSQESRFLFLRNFLGTPSGILSVPQVYCTRPTYIGITATPSKTRFLQKNPQENTGKRKNPKESCQESGTLFWVQKINSLK